MKSFNVLNRDIDLHQHYLLEASAGTGKTFSIQNIVVRLLTDPRSCADSFLIQNILVVTFTRAATRDLKNRIRFNIEDILNRLNEYLLHGLISENFPDYLKEWIEQGENRVQHARRRLQQALFTFDQAQIFTIHSFCARMLRQYAMESDVGLHSSFGEGSLPHTEMMMVIRDFFRTELHRDLYSPNQIRILLKGDPEQKILLKTVQRGEDFFQFPSFKQLYEKFILCMRALKQSLLLNSEKMMEDFLFQVNFYRNEKNGMTKLQTLKKITDFALLFDKDEWSPEDLDRLIDDGIVWVSALNPSLLKKSIPQIDRIHFPTLRKELQDSLCPIIREGSDFGVLISRMGHDCRLHLKRYQKEEEKFSPDDLLQKMHSALDQRSFLEHVRAHYHAVIIDEFQDTDPLQWDIFKRLFLPNEEIWKGYLYLVGDPKQSIYSFRQADIYTYLTARKMLGDSRCFSLDVNYRSQPQLVDALNTLFDAQQLSSFIPLPKISTHLTYQPVQASNTTQSEIFNDFKSSIHFFMADGHCFEKPELKDLENAVFFPFIVNEIKRLKDKQSLDYQRLAVLVRDRHQALRLAEWFDRYKIPYLNQKGSSLAHSLALQAIKELIYALLNPNDLVAIRTALGNALLGWRDEEIKNLEPFESILFLLHHLKEDLFKKGFAAFFQQMLKTIISSDGKTILENILAREGGMDFYHDLQQIADIIVDHQYLEWNSPEGIIPFLDLFQIWDQNEDERIKRFQDQTKNGVKILTLHFSKGLEFDVVFALGLVNRVKIRENLIPIELHGKTVLYPLSEEEKEYHEYCEECDAEKMRQFYVALTRAKHLLYIPIALHLQNEKLQWGEASPVELFLARFRQPPPESYEALYDRMKINTAIQLLDFLNTQGQLHSISYSIHQEILCHSPDEIEVSFPLTLHEPSAVSVPGKSLWITSFSSLSKQKESKAVFHLATHMSFPNDLACQIKNQHTLPAGNETGLLFHHLLEKLDFKAFKHLQCFEDAIPIVQPFLQHTEYREWISVVARMVFSAFKTPLFPISENFCLAELETNQFFREMPFVYSLENEQYLEEMDFTDGVIKGVIDLLLYYDGKYYLVDWKTNWLGLDDEAYENSLLESAMRDNAYFLQASIYTEAIKKFLRTVDRRPFEDCFGGVFYIFLRGLISNQRHGIYHFF